MSRRDALLPDNGPTDARHVPMSRVQQLHADAQAAAEERALAEHPDVIALRVQKVRDQVDAAMWTGILLGLAFTMVNVQQFAAENAAVWSLPWIAAWLLDPMVSLVLIAVLRAEQITARWQVETGPWIRAAKWFAFAATYTMNTWQSYAAGHVAGIVLHSVPPLLVYVASEAAPVLRDRLTEAVKAAAHTNGDGGEQPFTPPAMNTAGTVHDGVHDTTPPGVHDTVHAPVHEPGAEGVHEQPAGGVRERAERAPAKRTRATGRKSGKAGTARKTRADYVAAARAVWAPGIEVTPAWVRQQTDCSRGISSAVAAELRAEIDNQDRSASERVEVAV